MRTCPYLFGMIFMVACATESQEPVIHLPPNGGVGVIGHVPGGGVHTTLFNGGSTFMFIGPTAPGSASYSNAPVIDISQDPMTVIDNPGDGTMNVTINGTGYTGASVQSIGLLLSDPTGDYVGLDAFTTYPGPGGVEYASEVTVIVPASDFAVGATVALDGNERVAVFANGPADAMDPTLVGAAITGSLTFTAGDLNTTISGTLSGDFGQIAYVPDPQPTGSITAGSYALAITGPSQAYCDGTLAGHEADFAGVTAASLGIGSAQVTITTPTASEADITGAPGFAGAFALLGDPSGNYAGITNETGSGPNGTMFVGKYLVFDGNTATPMFINGGAGAGYTTTDNLGSCTVAFDATLTGP